MSGLAVSEDGKRAILEVTELSKRYGAREAVRSLSFQVRAGETFGLLGPNGAGKTTTIGMIAGVLQPTTGSIRLGGIDAHHRGPAIQKKVGLVPQKLALYPALSALENLSFLGRLYGVTGPILKKRVERSLELAGLSGRSREPVGQFSGGMKRRLNIVGALLHEPELLLLDEPTVGVDPQSRERIFETLRALTGMGMALLLTTHYLDEAERLCGRLAVMDEGKFVGEGTVDELIALVGGESTVELTLERPASGALLDALRSRQADARSDRQFRIAVVAFENWLPELLAAVAAGDNEVKELRVHRPDLGDVFLRLTGKELRD